MRRGECSRGDKDSPKRCAKASAERGDLGLAEPLLRVQLDAGKYIDDCLARIRLVVEIRSLEPSVAELHANRAGDGVRFVRHVDHMLAAETPLLPRADVDDRSAEVRALLDAG